ncbi:MAG: signal peptidase II [Myxococcota bacterium]
MNHKFVVFTAVLVAGIGLDQLSKGWVVANLVVGRDEIPIIPGFLSVVHAQNHGAAFSSFEGMWGLFMVFTAVATVVVLDLLRRLRPDALFMAGVLGLILSGALGNGIDRIRMGYVTDFIRVYTELEGPKAWFIQNFGTNTWPIFNIADSVLLIGVTLFLVHYLFLEEAEPDSDAVDEALGAE